MYNSGICGFIKVSRSPDRSIEAEAFASSGTCGGSDVFSAVHAPS